jgi:hypothetical protein
MQDYRVYYLDRDGRIDRFEAIIADDDDTAMRRATEAAQTRPYELWCRGRLVAKSPNR